MDAIKADLDKCLSSGQYVPLFLDDLIDLVINQGISPEVIFREIRAIEGKDAPLLKDRNSEPFIVNLSDDPKEAFRGIFRPSPSATKRSTEFKKPPLKGLHHWHYYVHRRDFIEKNVKNQRKKHKEFADLPWEASIITKTAEEELTGEWIIFKKANGINTYICLAKHTDGDKSIHNRLIANGVDLL